MKDFLQAVNNEVLIGDGAIGTMLFAAGMPRGENPELWTYHHPDILHPIYRAYLKAGSQILQTNTFGANSLKLGEYQAAAKVEEVNLAAARLVRNIAGSEAFVAGIVGPSGHFPAPLGDIEWTSLVEVFGQQMQALAAGGVDFIFLETFADLGEIRAALYAAKKYTTLPVVCSLTYTKGRTLTGTSPEVAAAVLEAMGADVIGANCSTGPEELLPIMQAYRAATRLPLLVEPNAGVPELINGQTVFRESPQALAAFVEPFRLTGVNLIGACCGSTPEHIRAMAEALQSSQSFDPYSHPDQTMQNTHALSPAGSITVLTSRSKFVRLGTGELPVIIGERINPTARKLIAQALREGHWDQINREGAAQLEAGAQLLDFNTGLPGGDEVFLLGKGVRHLQMSLDAPLVLDCTNPQALEKGLQEYQGKALINSVNGEEKSLAAVLPLAKKYGAACIGLTLDEKGIPETAEERLDIAARIVNRALSLGIPRENILVDCLVLTAAVNPTLARETIKAIALVKKELGVNTVLGLSNVSHGLPQRSWLNSTFLALALEAGLDAVIANPSDIRIQETVAAGALLAGRDPAAKNYLALAGKSGASTEPSLPKSPQDTLAQPPNSDPTPEAMQNMIFHGQQEPLIPLVKKLLEKYEPLVLINKGIIPPLEKMGDLFAKGEVYLPQLMLAGDAAKLVFSLLRQSLPGEAMAERGTVVIGTVKGDVHDIGKNIVAALLENHGFRVVNIGKGVPAEEFVRVAKSEKADIVALSALMTTTMVEMKPVIDMLRQEHVPVKVIVGGAVVTADYAREIGADGYGKDAVEAVRLIQSLIK